MAREPGIASGHNDESCGRSPHLETEVAVDESQLVERPERAKHERCGAGQHHHAESVGCHSLIIAPGCGSAHVVRLPLAASANLESESSINSSRSRDVSI
jgi:hypothetical protein